MTLTRAVASPLYARAEVDSTADTIASSGSIEASGSARQVTDPPPRSWRTSSSPSAIERMKLMLKERAIMMKTTSRVDSEVLSFQPRLWPRPALRLT